MKRFFIHACVWASCGSSFAQTNSALDTLSQKEDLDEVVISTTRSSRTISNTPTRLEVISGEELDEKGNMKPGDIRLILSESTGIQTQQTSATSANSSIRIQGLDGRYTQILKDGFPLYSGAASGLGLLQIPPLDLKQVEVVKGSASTLYGGGAIAGLVNLVSKTPGSEREFNVHLNGTTAGGLDASSFYSERFGKSGITLFVARNSNKAYAPGNTDFTAIPDFERFTLNPKLFFYFKEGAALSFGINGSFENRLGGHIRFGKDPSDPESQYFERNKTERVSSQLSFSYPLGEKAEFNVKNSVSYFNRGIGVPDYYFKGRQYGSFSEVNYLRKGERVEWIGGLNLWTDQFTEKRQEGFPLRDYTQTTVGAFMQANIHASEWMELESGIRSDYVADYGLALLPRVSALFKFSRQLTSRLGMGMGYKAPTVFTEESERIQYRNVLPVSSRSNILEKSYGINWDVNYNTTAFDDQVTFSINQMFFYTYLNHPLTLETIEDGLYEFKNLSGHIDSRGIETNLKITYDDLKLFLGYSFTDTEIHSEGVKRQNPLTARHRLNNVLMYELEEKWKVGAEAYYFSKQRLSDGKTGKDYWIFGFMAERLWERFSLYINFENFTDTRQTRFDSIYTGPVNSPVFADIYAPLDGFVVNGGIKIRL